MTKGKIKTEHSGAKKGRGAYYGKKKDAKKDSNKKRRAKERPLYAESDRIASFDNSFE